MVSKWIEFNLFTKSIYFHFTHSITHSLFSLKYQKAYLVLKECHRMKPEHLITIILLAKLALENLLLVSIEGERERESNSYRIVFKD